MTPDDLCKSGREHGEQMALFAWAACAAKYGFLYADNDLSYDHRTRDAVPSAPYPVKPLEYLHAIHNQGHGDAIRGARAKAEGVRAGVPDVFLPCPRGSYAGLYIENKQRKFKDKKGGGLSEAQNDWISYLRGAGYAVRVAYGWREAADHIKAYMIS